MILSTTILVLMIFHALLSHGDSTSNLPRVPDNVQPSAENSNDAPAKKVLRTGETMEHEERFANGWTNKIKSFISNKRLERRNKLLKQILPRDPLPSSAIDYSLTHKKMKSVLKKFKNEGEDMLLGELSKSYGGVYEVITGLLAKKGSGGRRGKKAEELLKMQLNSWGRKHVGYGDAFNTLKLNDGAKSLVIFDTRVTFLEDYIKLTKSADKVDEAFFKTLEDGFQGRDKFLNLITNTIANHGVGYKEKSLNIGSRYMAYLKQAQVDEKKLEAFGSAMDTLKKRIQQSREKRAQTVVINVVRRNRAEAP